MNSSIYKLIYKYDKKPDYDIFTSECKKENEKNEIIKILGEKYVKNNKNKVKICINNKKYKLKSFLNVQEIKSEKIKVIIIEYNEISNRSYMFSECNSLIYISQQDNDIIQNKNEDNKYIEEKDDFTEDANLYSISEKSYHSYHSYHTFYSEITYTDEGFEFLSRDLLQYYKQNIAKNINNSIFDMMFYKCDSLKTIPNLSIYNNNNLFSASHMFYNE